MILACPILGFVAPAAVRVGTVTVHGQQTIRQATILREIDLPSGSMYRDESLYDAYQRLYLTGYFDRVDVTTQSISGGRVNLALRVRERPTRFAKGGIGYGTETKEKLIVGLEDRYFLNTQTVLDFTLSHAGFLTHPNKYRTTLIQMGLQSPRAFFSRLDGQTQIAREYRHREAYRCVTTAWRSSLGRTWWTTFSIQLRYRFQGDRI